MKKNIVYIGLGSNIDEPVLQIKNAISALGKLRNTDVLADSGYFTSKPMGPEDQPDYMNAVVKIETSLTAKDLLKNCQLIEQQQGRVKLRHWGERCIDLDILLYASLQISEPDLVVPHTGICQRDFVYKPLLKLNPEIEIPGKGLLSVLVASAQLKDVSDIEYDSLFAGNIE